MGDAHIPDGSSLSPRTEEEPSLAVAPMATDAAPLPVLVRCQICLEDIVADDGDWTVALTACGHCFCIVCITAFLNVQITDGCVDLACFHDDNQICQTEIIVEDIQRLVTPTMFAKYERFRLLRKNPQARQCPHCSFVHVTTGSKDKPTCVCTACEKRFCFVHADAHAADESCKQFEKRQSKRERRSGRVVKRISRPCPQCTQPIQKNGGCVHMTCAVCKAEFCWWCGETWGFNYERHYNQLLDAECCDGIAYEQVPGLNSPHTALRWLARFWYYLSIVAVGIPTTIVLIVVYAWVWAPAAWKGENKIHPRSVVRFIAIRFLQVMLFVAYVVAIVIAFIVIVLADGLGWLTRKLRALGPIVRPRLQRCCPRPRSCGADKEAAESELGSPAFVVLQDLERGREEEEL